jgi:glycosyltransferase involved in cell wall biosynthesis
VYRQEAYIEACLDSIASNGYQSIEIIICDDASPDDTHTVIERWIENHPGIATTYLRHQQNQGLTKTLNKMIRIAGGTFICTIAGDDMLLPGGIAARVTYLLEHPDKLAVFADCEVIDAEGQLLCTSGIEELYPAKGMRRRDLVIDALMVPTLVFHWAVPGPVFLCRAETFDSVGMYDEHLRAEDFDMYLRIAMRGGLGFYNGCVSQYRIHGSSISAVARPTIIDSIVQTHRKHLRHLHGIEQLRLFALICTWHYQRATTPAARAALFVISGTLMLTSSWLHRLRRAFLRMRWQSQASARPLR